MKVVSDRRDSRYISQQINYSLLSRTLVPVGVDQRTGIMAWSPLHSGCPANSARPAKPSDRG